MQPRFKHSRSAESLSVCLRVGDSVRVILINLFILFFYLNNFLLPAIGIAYEFAEKFVFHIVTFIKSADGIPTH